MNYNKTRVVIYIRVSTDEQAKEGVSLATQQEKASKFIESQENWELVEVYIDDGYSAKDLNRPRMKKLIEDAQANKFDVVLFFKLDRLVRSVSSLHTLLKVFEKHHVSIKSVTEVFDTTSAIGRFFITLVAAMAEWERETISERVLLNMEKRAKDGARNGGKAPFGYRLVDGKLEIFEEEAILIREMFSLYNKGKGLRKIVMYFNEFNIPKDIRTIGRMLDNPIYCGKIRWGNNSSKIDTIIKDSSEIPSIINEEVFSSTQKLRRRNKIEGKKSTSTYPFSGILRCARCGSPLSGLTKSNTGTKHYICVGKKNKGICNLPIFKQEALSHEFLKQISPDNPTSFISSLKPVIHHQNESEDESLKIEIKKKLDSIKKRKKNWMLALGDGTMSHDDYSLMMSEALKNENLLYEQLENLTVMHETIDTTVIIEMAQNISELWNMATEFEKKQFVRELFKEIVVDVPTEYVRGRGKTPSVIIKDFKLQ